MKERHFYQSNGERRRTLCMKKCGEAGIDWGLFDPFNSNRRLCNPRPSGWNCDQLEYIGEPSITGLWRCYNSFLSG